ncbi:MAG: NAD(P)-dependent oxidoreductase [Alphaproteobacteria bacterium]
MLPIVLDPKSCRIAVVGRGAPAARRLRGLLEGGATELTVFSDRPDGALTDLAGARLERRLPDAERLRDFAVVWIVDLDTPTAERLARAARDVGTLVNVEDVTPLCDFHTPSVVRRGDLLLTVSTGGRSPGLAARVRRRLERLFGPEWAGRLDQVGRRRDDWRRQGRRLRDLARLTDDLIDRQGWLS